MQEITCSEFFSIPHFKIPELFLLIIALLFDLVSIVFCRSVLLTWRFYTQNPKSCCRKSRLFLPNPLNILWSVWFICLCHLFVCCSQHLPVPEVSGGVGVGPAGWFCAGVQVRVSVALLALHSERLRLVQISGAGKSFTSCFTFTWTSDGPEVKSLFCISFFLCLFLPRRSLSSLFVWRLHQTSYASSSSPSNGCFSLPAPTCGSSTCGTQVSLVFIHPSYYDMLLICGHFLAIAPNE